MSRHSFGIRLHCGNCKKHNYTEDVTTLCLNCSKSLCAKCAAKCKRSSHMTITLEKHPKRRHSYIPETEAHSGVDELVEIVRSHMSFGELKSMCRMNLFCFRCRKPKFMLGTLFGGSKEITAAKHCYDCGKCYCLDCAKKHDAHPREHWHHLEDIDDLISGRHCRVGRAASAPCAVDFRLRDESLNTINRSVSQPNTREYGMLTDFDDEDFLDEILKKQQPTAERSTSTSAVRQVLGCAASAPCTWELGLPDESLNTISRSSSQPNTHQCGMPTDFDHVVFLEEILKKQQPTAKRSTSNSAVRQGLGRQVEFVHMSTTAEQRTSNSVVSQELQNELVNTSTTAEGSACNSDVSQGLQYVVVYMPTPNTPPPPYTRQLPAYTRRSRRSTCN